MTTAKITTANIQNVNVGSAFLVAPGATVDLGGNRVQNVGTPVAGSDAASKAYVDSSVNVLNTGLNQAFKKIDQNTQGIAIAIAMGGLTLSGNKDFAISGNVGFYDSKQALAFQSAIRLGPVVTLNGGVGFGLNDTGKVGGRVGLQAEF